MTRANRRYAAGLLAGVAALALAACSSSAVTGTGSAVPPPVGTSAPAFPTQPATSPVSTGQLILPSSPPVVSSSVAVPTSPAARTYEKAITFQGTSTGTIYHALIWDTDDIADCATHAYGAAMIDFLRQHPCDGARRVLATLVLNGRTVDLSLVSTGFPPAGSDLYGNTAKFVKLELANGTGSINDLLSEGGYLPGAVKIPSNEAFDVLAQDNGATVFDAWYASGPTQNQDKTLLSLEEDLYLSRLQDG